MNVSSDRFPAHPMQRGGGSLRLRGLLRKEWLQILRDPSSIAVAFLMPVVLLLLFGYGVSLDAQRVPIALVVEQPSADTASITGAFLLTLYTGLVLFVVSAIGVGLMISSLSVTMQQGLLGAFLFLVPAIILSGFTTPIANMPPLVQDITLINPMRYFLVVLRSVFLEGTPFHLLIDQFWPLTVIGAVSLTLAGWLFRHRLY